MTGTTIRTMGLADIPAGLVLCRASGWNQLEADWLEFLGSGCGGGWVAERDGKVVGTVAYRRYGTEFTWLSMMLVHPDWRRLGIGAALMETACSALEGDACIRLDATPLGAPLYVRFGFQDECRLVRARVLPGPRGPEGWHALPGRVRPLTRDDFEAVFAMDRREFGADRSSLLVSFYERAPELAWVIGDGEELRGYCFGRPGCLYRQVGPVMAEDTAAARSLVLSCLNVRGEGLVIDAPLHEASWVKWLETIGFTVERTFVRMYRGRLDQRVGGREFAIAGPEFG